MLTEDQIKDALKAVKYPGYSRDIVSFGLVRSAALRGRHRPSIARADDR